MADDVSMRELKKSFRELLDASNQLARDPSFHAKTRNELVSVVNAYEEGFLSDALSEQDIIGITQEFYELSLRFTKRHPNIKDKHGRFYEVLDELKALIVKKVGHFHYMKNGKAHSEIDLDF